MSSGYNINDLNRCIHDDTWHHSCEELSSVYTPVSGPPGSREVLRLHRPVGRQPGILEPRQRSAVLRETLSNGETGLRWRGHATRCALIIFPASCSHWAAYPRVCIGGHIIGICLSLTCSTPGPRTRIRWVPTRRRSCYTSKATPVIEVTPIDSPSRKWNLTTPGALLSCSYVLHATNAYALHILPPPQWSPWYHPDPRASHRLPHRRALGRAYTEGMGQERGLRLLVPVSGLECGS